MTDILHLFLEYKWYDMIECGAKKVEYRRICDFWNSRLLAIDSNDKIIYRRYKKIVFHRAYTSTVMEWTIEGITTGYGDVKLGAYKGEKCYIITLGKRLK